jgi:hypothetical protein
MFSKLEHTKSFGAYFGPMALYTPGWTNPYRVNFRESRVTVGECAHYTTHRSEVRLGRPLSLGHAIVDSVEGQINDLEEPPLLMGLWAYEHMMAVYAVKHVGSQPAARVVGSIATARIRYTADADYIIPSCLNVAQNHGPPKLAVRSVAGFKAFPILEALPLPHPEHAISLITSRGTSCSVISALCSALLLVATHPSWHGPLTNSAHGTGSL